VPTWDYVAIHAYGAATTFEGAERLRPHLAALTSRFESGFESPWGLADAPDDYIDAMCRGIVGIEIALTRTEGKWKLSQNRAARDREGVVRGLRALGSEANEVLANLVGDRIEESPEDAS
jgi:transcriptional regulator